MSGKQALSKSFEPVSRADAKILILGSLPGVQSLQQQQYYAHPRNAFWPIMAALFNDGQVPTEYLSRLNMLLQRQIALWDVIAEGRRLGSLDSSIESASVRQNDFNGFFRRHQALRYVFFNGGKAEQQFKVNVIKRQCPDLSALKLQRLPSTSPALASMTLADKLQQWQIVAEVLNENA